MRPGERFTDYAILGDDIIIADEAVAKEYELALQRLLWGSDILSKISKTGCGEFAKRFMVKGMSKDFSPISIRI